MSGRRNIPVRATIEYIKNRDVWTVLIAKIYEGPQHLLDRTVGVILPTPKDTMDVAIRLLKEFIPHHLLRKRVGELEELVKKAKEGF